MNYNDFGPFSSEVWGTVSDWAIFIVTTLGTWYVVKTFIQQKKINEEQLALNKEQKELNRLAMEKDRRDLMPTFKFESEENTDIALIGKLKAIENSARNVQIFKVLNNAYYPVFGGPIYRCSPHNPHATINLEIVKNESPDFRIQYVLYFEDEVGRPYTQDIGSQNNLPSVIIPLPVEKDFINNIDIKPYRETV